jgi:ABC-2 type transport system ATP-binding protein
LEGNAVVVQDLIKEYPKVRAVDGISFTVGSREIFGLLGPNGAGKTTLLNILCGLFRPTEGSVSIFGMTFRDNHNDIRRLLGYIP